MKTTALILCMFLLAGCLSGCGSAAREIPSGNPRIQSVPQRLVRQIDVALHPENPEVDRVYTRQAPLNKMIRLMREIDCSTPAPHPEALDQADSYYSFTFTYSDGSQREFRLLSHQYFNNSRDGWVEIPRDQAMKLTSFILKCDSSLDENGVYRPGYLEDAPDPVGPVFPSAS